MKRILIFILVLFLMLSPSAVTADEEESSKVKKDSVVFFGGLSYSNSLFHSVSGLTLVQAAVGYERVINKWVSVRISGYPVFTQIDPESNYGVGWDLDFISYFGDREKNHFYGEFGAGMVFFNDEFPKVHTSSFNFSLLVGTGLVFPLKATESIFIGGRFCHISNSATGEENPGVNAMQFLVGYKYQF